MHFHGIYLLPPFFIWISCTTIKYCSELGFFLSANITLTERYIITYYILESLPQCSSFITRSNLPKQLESTPYNLPVIRGVLCEFNMWLMSIISDISAVCNIVIYSGPCYNGIWLYLIDKGEVRSVLAYTKIDLGPLVPVFCAIFIAVSIALPDLRGSCCGYQEFTTQVQVESIKTLISFVKLTCLWAAVGGKPA